MPELPRISGKQATALVGWLALTFSAAATGVFVKTGGWYAELAKPTWNPPGMRCTWRVRKNVRKHYMFG